MAPPEPRERQRRRKITLACEPCRERKARCDGRKPICSTCEHRSLGLEQCVYKAGNARTACSDEYTRALHERIRKLEQACALNGVEVGADGAVVMRSPVVPGVPGVPGVPRPGSHTNSPVPAILGLPDRRTERPTTSTATTPDPELETGGVSAMGTVLDEEGLVESARRLHDDFFGLSSTASFLKEAASSMHRRQALDSRALAYGSAGTGRSAGAGSSGGGLLKFSVIDKFTLPPRALADHFMQRYWERLFYLYPFFDRAAFEHAYASLWQTQVPARKTPAAAGEAAGGTAGGTADGGSADGVAMFEGCGLGGPEADASSIAFHCALNAIFALGCTFSDLPEAEKSASCDVFFNRSKSFVGLDFIDENNVAVVQSLLIVALALQGTPFPNRCWNAVGMACRVAQGLGLHTDVSLRPRSAREKEIRHRTWHGCVVMDVLVGMTFGRPTMTSSLSIPASSLDIQSATNSAVAESSSEQLKLIFYRESLRLSIILEGILQKIYEPWLSREVPTAETDAAAPGLCIRPSLDTVVGLQDQLAHFEQSVTPYLSWLAPAALVNMSDEDRHELEMQRNVLHARFVYMQLILHRPLLTQLTAPDGAAAPGRAIASASSALLSRDSLHYSFALECAKSCVEAAKRLILHVHETYLTDKTDAWWWNGLYACTAGLVLIVSRLCPDLWKALDAGEIADLWERCQSVLQRQAYFSVSARKSMTLLLKVNENVLLKQAARESRLHRQNEPDEQSQAPAPAHDEAVAEAQRQFQAHMDMMGQLDPTAAMLDDTYTLAPLFNWDQSLEFMYTIS